ncbi:MAG: bifunctional 3-(3-hydroxy-phenyl)propionate/3-hydroxycinnamic acid hydroxylase [Ktedonobacteraceae bacterium]
MNTPIGSHTPHECQRHSSVIIVGGGPAGLSAANLLGLAGIDTLVIERNSELSAYPKAISLDDEGLRICQAMGLSAAMRHCVLSDINAHYLFADRILAKVAPTSKRNGYPLISTFNQPEFETTLLAGLNRFACVDILFQHTVEAVEQTAERVVVSVHTPTGERQQFACSYLLACDGGRSTIRHALNIPMKGSTFGQKWLVIDCVADDEPSAIAKFFCNPQRPAVTVPSPHNGRRWEFMLLPGETETELLHPEKISALIRQAGGSLQPHIIRSAIYTFHSTLARQFSQGRVFLLGDAAHMMPPFGGQGLNSGLRDAHNLCWKLSLVLHGLAHPQLLETYHQERYKHVAQMIFFSSFLGNIVMSTKKPVALVRNLLLEGSNTVPAMRDYLTEGRIKPQPKYTAGFFIPDGKRDNRAITGFMLPQPVVTTLQGNNVLLDEMLGGGFAIIALHPHASRAFTQLHSTFWESLNTRMVCVQPQLRYNESRPYSEIATMNSNSASYTTVTSNDDNFLRNNRDLFVVVRPDRYVLGVFTEEKAEQFVSAFKRLLCPV